MAKVRVVVVHDESGRILSVARPSDAGRVDVLSGHRQSVVETDVDEDGIAALVDGRHTVGVARRTIVAHGD